MVSETPRSQHAQFDLNLEVRKRVAIWNFKCDYIFWSFHIRSFRVNLKEK